MIFCNFWKDGAWGQNIIIDTLTNNVIINDRFTDELSEASFTTYDTDLADYVLPIEAWTKCKITLDDGTIKNYVLAQYDSHIVTFGQDALGHTKYGNIHQVDIKLIAQSALAQQIYPDSLCFSNGLEDGVVITHTIREMLSRIRNQLWTIPEADKGANYQNLPFDFIWDNSLFWLDNTAPEMFFTNKSLFEIFVEIGKVIGGFPFLNFDDETEKFILSYRLWQDLSTPTWEDMELVNISKHSTIMNQANVLVGNLENLQNMSLNGENTIVEPCKDNYMPVTTETYTTEITDATAAFKVRRPIAKILKLIFKSNKFGYTIETDKQYIAWDGTPIKLRLESIIAEYTKWQTLPASFVSSLIDYTQDNVLYYKLGNNTISNLYMELTAGIGVTNRLAGLFYLIYNVEEDVSPQRYSIEVTYIPYESAKVKMWKDNAKKPIMEIYNQSANVVSSSAIGDNMYGLVNRLEGKYSIYQKRVNRGTALYKVGEWLNGEIIIEATHEINNVEINSLYQTSPFNRRSEFMAVQNNIRLWEIPEDKITNRDLHYAENIEVSIGTVIDTTDRETGSLTALGNTLIRDFNTTETVPDLAYIAWKSTDEISGDDNVNSNNYALATVASLPLSKAALITWTANDNANMGNRSYSRFSTFPNRANTQTYIAYDEQAEYLNFKLSNVAPTSYVFSDNYIPKGSDVGNQNFTFSFPASNKLQWTECDTTKQIANFGQWFIQKDLREQIKFNIQFDFIGKNGTLVYARAVSINRICTNTATTSLKIFVNSASKYSTYDTKAHSDSTEIAVTSFAEVTNGLQLSATIPTYENLAITDSENNLLFATNISGEAASALTVYMLNLKKEWEKL